MAARPTWTHGRIQTPWGEFDVDDVHLTADGSISLTGQRVPIMDRAAQNALLNRSTDPPLSLQCARPFCPAAIDGLHVKGSGDCGEPAHPINEGVPG